MQPIERSTPLRKEPSSRFALPSYETVRAKEKKGLSKLGTALADTVRDVDTASKMAADKFDGDSALMHAARGGLTTLIGIGLEKALDQTWKLGISGVEPILHKPYIILSAKAVEAMEKLGEKYKPLYYFARESTKDIVTGVIYNALSYFSRPMLHSIEGKHLVRSVFINALESVIEDPSIIAKDIDLGKENRKAASSAPHPEKLTFQENTMERPWLRRIPLGLLQSSNPATQLGVDMMFASYSAIKRNLKEVSRVRKEKGGLEGKQVYIPRQDDRKPYSRNNRVYYGKSGWNKPKQEDDLEKFI